MQYAFATSGCSAADKGLNADTTYCYKVAATDDRGRESALSNQSCAQTMPLACAGGEKTRTVSVEKAIIEKGRATIDIKFDFDKSVVKPKYHR